MGSSHNADADFHQLDERRLRDVIKHLKSSCSQLQSSMLELESVHSVNDAPRDVTRVSSASSVVDLEQAVLVQELMAMKVTHCESIVCFCSFDASLATGGEISRQEAEPGAVQGARFSATTTSLKHSQYSTQ